MKRYMLLICVLITLCIGQVFAVTNQFKGKNINIVVETSYKPYEYLSPSGEMIGLDIDIINYICNKLQAKCKLHTSDFDSIIPSIIYKKYDFGMAGFSITEERKKMVAFSEPYAPGLGVVYVSINKNNLSQVRNVGLQSGTVHYPYVSKFTNFNILQYPDIASGILDLQSGRIDAFFIDNEAFEDLSADNPNIKVISEPVFHPLLGEGIAAVFNKQNKELRAAYNEVLLEMKKNGELQKIYKKYNYLN